MIQKNRIIFFLLLWLLPGSLLAESGANIPRIEGPCHLNFPIDHGPHHEYLVEWWYYTGNLKTLQGRPFGFELTFFRQRIIPEYKKTMPEPASSWRTDQAWAAHFAISDIQGNSFHQDQLVMRGAMGLAGTKLQGDTWNFNVLDWRIRIAPQAQKLRAQTEDMAVSFDFTPQKGPILHGHDGYSQKGSNQTSASCYVSFPRLQGSGKIRLAEQTYQVKGNAWMDHEFSSALLEEGLEGWDWFSLQFSDQTELMFYVLRKKEGGMHSASAGTFIDQMGQTLQISSENFSLQVLDKWPSRRTGIVYPSGWRLSISSLDLQAIVQPRMKNQEMLTERSAGRNYWEGSVIVSGSRNQKNVNGTGYVELTGYGKPFGSLEEDQ